MRPRSGLLLLFVIVTLGPSCSDRSVEEERISEPLEVVAEFVPMGPVRTEAEAVAAAWRYIEAHSEDFLSPPLDTVNGVVYEELSMAIDTLRGPTIRVDPTDSTKWGVMWELRDGGIPGAVGFLVDKSTGDVELAPSGM